MPCHSIMKLASNNGQKLLFFPLIYGNHKSCGVICSLTKHLMNPVNALKECRIVNPIESNFIVNLIVLNLQKSLLNRIENLSIALESIRCLPKDSQLFFTVIGQTEDFACVSMCILSILNYMYRIHICTLTYYVYNIIL